MDEKKKNCGCGNNQASESCCKDSNKAKDESCCQGKEQSCCDGAPEKETRRCC